MLEQVSYSLSLSLDGTGRSLLYHNIAILAFFESKEHKVNSLFEAHDEAGHLRLSQRDGVALANLVNPERDDGSTAAHYITLRFRQKYECIQVNVGKQTLLFNIEEQL